MYGQCSIAMCWFPEGIYQKLNIELWVTWSNLAIPEWEPPCRVAIVMTPVIPSNAWPYISIIYHLGKPLYDGVPLYLHWWLSAGVYFPVLHNSFPVSIHILLIHIPFSHTSTHTWFSEAMWCPFPSTVTPLVPDLRSSLLGLPVAAGLLLLSRQRHQTTDGAATGVGRGVGGLGRVVRGAAVVGFKWLWVWQKAPQDVSQEP